MKQKFFTDISALAAMLSLLATVAADGASGRKNVLFIAVDDLRPELGAYGREHMVTPHMDRLAAEGRLFERHYVQAPTCSASRYALLTGQHLRHYGKSFELYDDGLAPVSFPEWFRHSGYYTVLMGKVSHSPDGYQWRRERRQYFRTGNAPEVPGAWNEMLTPSGKWGSPWFAFFGYDCGDTRRVGFQPPMESADVDDMGYPDGWIAEAAVEQLRKLRDLKQPFMLAVGFFKPHLPFTAPRKYWDLYDRAAIDISDVDPLRRRTGEFFSYSHEPERVENDPDYVRELRHGYYASTSYVDAQVGKVLDALDELGLADDTIVVLWGDHGYHLGETGYWGKHTLHEYALRSPLIVRVPGMRRSGEHARGIVSSIDIYPTLVDLAGLRMPDHLDGRSLRPMLDNPDAGSAGYSVGFRDGNYTLRSDGYRLIDYGDTVELYDRKSDPRELRNIADEHPEVVEAMMYRLKQILAARKAR